MIVDSNRNQQSKQAPTRWGGVRGEGVREVVGVVVGGGVGGGMIGSG